MKISLLLPTHRVSRAAIARVCECASLDPGKFEVIVRDNSSDENKRKMLEAIRSDTVKLYSADDHGAFENSVEVLKLATGDFVYWLADDDWISARGLLTLHQRIEQVQRDETVACATGAYFIETSRGAGMFKYPDVLDSNDSAARLQAYFGVNAPNVLYYSAVRRSLATFCFDFMGRLPYKFSYHDQLISMLYLALGRITQIDNVVYFYDLGEWETSERSLSKDRAMYAAAGLPPEIDRLHWLLCAMEGGFLLNSQFIADKAKYERAAMTNIWFSNMFHRFKHHLRDATYAPGVLNDATLKLRNKWLESPTINLNELLFDVCDVIEAVDPEASRKYFDFWSSL